MQTPPWFCGGYYPLHPYPPMHLPRLKNQDICLPNNILIMNGIIRTHPHQKKYLNCLYAASKSRSAYDFQWSNFSAGVTVVPTF
jgi:hypothetical protein